MPRRLLHASTLLAVIVTSVPVLACGATDSHPRDSSARHGTPDTTYEARYTAWRESLADSLRPPALGQEVDLHLLLRRQPGVFRGFIPGRLILQTRDKTITVALEEIRVVTDDTGRVYALRTLPEDAMAGGVTASGQIEARPIEIPTADLTVTPGTVPAWLRPHAVIRLTSTGNVGNRPLVGEFREARSDSIWIQARHTQRDVALPLAQILRFEVSQEQSPRTWTGAGIGFLVGALIGAAVGASEGRQQGDTGVRIVVGGIIIGALGMIPGAIVGHSSNADHWTMVWSRDAR